MAMALHGHDLSALPKPPGGMLTPRRDMFEQNQTTTPLHLHPFFRMNG